MLSSLDTVRPLGPTWCGARTTLTASGWARLRHSTAKRLHFVPDGVYSLPTCFWKYSETGAFLYVQERRTATCTSCGMPQSVPSGPTRGWTTSYLRPPSPGMTTAKPFDLIM